MTEKSLLEGKRILAVDDEPDILETLEALLPMCVVVKASTADQAKKLMDSQPFDIAILDIMGVDGYKLLEIAKKKKIVAVMLTAHALSVESTIKSFKGERPPMSPRMRWPKLKPFLQTSWRPKTKEKTAGGAGWIGSALIMRKSSVASGKRTIRISGGIFLRGEDAGKTWTQLGRLRAGKGRENAAPSPHRALKVPQMRLVPCFCHSRSHARSSLVMTLFSSRTSPSFLPILPRAQLMSSSVEYPSSRSTWPRGEETFL